MDFQSIISQELKEAQSVLDQFLNDPVQIGKIEAAAQLMAEAINANGIDVRNSPVNTGELQHC